LFHPRELIWRYELVARFEERDRFSSDAVKEEVLILVPRARPSIVIFCRGRRSAIQREVNGLYEVQKILDADRGMSCRIR